MGFSLAWRCGKSGSGSQAGKSEHFLEPFWMTKMSAFEVEAFGFEARKASFDRPAPAIGFQGIGAGLAPEADDGEEVFLRQTF